MKIHIGLTLLILALGVPLGWKNRQRLTKARERHTQLVAEATRSMSIYHDPASRNKAVRDTKREHESKEQAATRIAADLIASGKKVNEDGTSQNSSLDSLAAVVSLDADQLKILFTEIFTSTELTDEARQKLLFSLAEVASDHPQAALAQVTNSEDFLKVAGLSKVLVSLSLTKWAKDDPLAVISWVRQNRANFLKLMDEEARAALVFHAAQDHPDLAFKMVGELGLDPSDEFSALSGVAEAPKTAEQRTTTLAAIKAHLASLPAGKKRDQMSELLITGIMNNAARDGFEAGSQWLDHTGFSTEQIKEMFEHNLVWVTELSETGKWVEWMAKTNTGEETNHWIKEMVRHWTEGDYLAASKWLESTPEGPVKNTSISAYAASLSHHHPAMAEQWALTLPPGEGRADTLNLIYKNWPKDDESAKQAFREKHEIK